MNNTKDKDFVEYIVKSIVDNPEDVKIERTVDEMGVLISLNINPEDMGQVIGRQGSTAKSIRTLLRVIGAKNNARVNFKIVEPEGSVRPQRPVTDRPVSNISATTTENVEDAVNDLNL
ncbi:KH domain-containing protein [Patescibacteria group bacterium]|nr:KH domain-containing protein [Patescibacteria group bacterium]